MAVCNAIHYHTEHISFVEPTISGWDEEQAQGSSYKKGVAFHL
jgi:hypothetical protein